MKTKREVLEEFVTYGDCKHTKCENCPYSTNNNFDCKLQAGDRLSQIGAMAILRMFPEKPTLDIGTKIKFKNGEIGVLKKENNAYVIRFEHSVFYWEYLIGKKWEVVE